MSIQLLESVQQNLGYPALLKIDTTTNQVVRMESDVVEDDFGQAAIPTVLVALCQYSQTDEGADDILHSDLNTNWVNKIFYNNRNEVVEAIAHYAKQLTGEIVENMNLIANEAISVAKENLTEDAGIDDVKSIFNAEKNDILLYLPPTLHIGELLYDNTLDDNTNKMEGPVSSLITSIGDVFSGSILDGKA